VAVTDDALQILGNTNKEESVHHRGDEGLSEIVFSATDREINDTMQNNNSAALFELGVKAMERENGASEAVSWWKKAALLGHVDAIFNMGVCCLQGVGMAEGCNETAAAMWFEKAALQGDGDARVFLIVCPMI
jgi:TPR repeat protein